MTNKEASEEISKLLVSENLSRNKLSTIYNWFLSQKSTDHAFHGHVHGQWRNKSEYFKVHFFLMFFFL